MTDFDIVWAQYPRKTAKAVARKAWNKLNPDTDTVQKMIDALKWQSQTDQWKRGIIPHMSTWLNQERFEDEKPTIQHTPRQHATARITALIASGMDRWEAIKTVENEVFVSEAPHGKAH